MLLNKISRHKEFQDIDPLGVNSINMFGNTPLHLVCTWLDASAVIYFIEQGADVNATGEDGLTPLHWAVEKDDADTVQILVVNGALNIEDDWAVTPLQLALSLKHQAIANILLNGFIH